jgi:hypothetical protein
VALGYPCGPTQVCAGDNECQDAYVSTTEVQVCCSGTSQGSGCVGDGGACLYDGFYSYCCPGLTCVQSGSNTYGTCLP